MRRVTKAELEEMLEERDQTLEELRAKIDLVLGFDEEEEDEDEDDSEDA